MLEVLHILALYAAAVAGPLFDVLRRNREFFIAYRATLGDLLIYAAAVSIVVPLVLALVVKGLGLVSRRAGRGALLAVVALLGATVGSQVLKAAAMPATTHVIWSVVVGVSIAAVYWRYAAARTFATFLSPAILIVPAVLLLHPSMRPFMFPADPAERAAGEVTADTPVVVVIFDQLPLTSLMALDRTIDAAHYPGFAALASASTWFRNATTVADLTGWAIPPIVTGRYPRPNRLPIAEQHPDNLFTFLSRSYRLKVYEPITALCPPSVCAERREPLHDRIGGMLLDSSVVYAHVLSPPSIGRKLPVLTDNWRGFIAAQRWQQRWISQRDQDRREAPERFLEQIRRDDPPRTLYFLHALLPHEPYMYLRTGQIFTEKPRLAGLQPDGRWIGDAWPVSQSFATHLLQVEYVDAYVSRLLKRLRDQGIYDRALVIVTADHGVSFRARHPFKGVDRVTIRDIMPVPLFIKMPGQSAGAIDDRPVQSVDIMPTIASVLGTRLTWPTHGVSILEEEATLPAPAVKTIFHTGAHRRANISPERLRAGDEPIARRVRLFGGEHVPFRTPLIAPHRELVGRETATIAAARETSLRVILEDPGQWRDVDPNGPVLPAVVAGRVMDERRRPGSAMLAVAVNGRIEGTTKTYDLVPGYEGFWSALINPKVLRKGRNDIEVFVVRDTPRGTSLTQAYSAVPPALAALNLVSEEGEIAWRARLTGFHPLEGPSTQRFRWTSGDATIEMPYPTGERPRSLRLGIVSNPRPAPLRVTFNGCVVFDGTVPKDSWHRTVPLRGCAAANADAANIAISSSTFVPPGTDARTLGIPFETIRLSPEDWPLPSAPLEEEARRARIALVEPPTLAPGAVLAAGTAALIEVRNLGNAAWPSALEGEPPHPVRLVATWRSGTATSRRTFDLPRVLYPSDLGQIWIRLDPPAGAAAGAYDVSFGIEQDGQAFVILPPALPPQRVRVR